MDISENEVEGSFRRGGAQAYINRLSVQRRVLLGVRHTLLIDIHRHYVCCSEAFGKDSQHTRARTVVKDMYDLTI